MRVNWISYYLNHDGYGRFSSRLVWAMQQWRMDVLPLLCEDIDRPQWMLNQMGVNWDDFTITCHLPRFVRKIPGKGRHWLYTMCETTTIPKSTARLLNSCGLDRIVVPCQHNLEAFANSGVKVPISIVPLGTDPKEFPVRVPDFKRPYTFLTIADRGTRKGWQEVYGAFYKAFGSKSTGEQNVRLIIKSTPRGNPLLQLLRRAKDWDPRIIIDIGIYSNMADFYAQGDCLALPSRCEGWGMPHREAAMMGLPVIVQQYAGLDDGNTDKWAIIVRGGKIQRVPSKRKEDSGEWMVADEHKVADAMQFCYYAPDKAELIGKEARAWLSEHQTYRDAAAGMIELMHDEGVSDAIKIGSVRRKSQISNQNGRDNRVVPASDFRSG
jgi:glycosyltransferase involved in cell wall biosynthesis